MSTIRTLLARWDMLVSQALVRMNGLVIFGIILGVTLVKWLLFELMTSMSSFYSFIMSSVLTLTLVIYLLAARNNAREYTQIMPWAGTVEPDDGQYKVPESAFDRVRHMLDEVEVDGTILMREDRVRRIWRDHPIRLIKILSWLLIPAGIFFLLAMWALSDGGSFRLDVGSSGSTGYSSAAPTSIPAAPSTYANPLFTFTPPSPAQETNGGSLPHLPNSLVLPWWLFLLCAVATVLVAWIFSWKWQYTIHLVTDWRIIRVTVPPALLSPLMPGSFHQVELRRLVTARTGRSSLGDAAKYGDIGLDSEANATGPAGDAEFNKIPYTPDPTLTAKIINEAKMSIQMRLSGVFRQPTAPHPSHQSQRRYNPARRRPRT